MRSLDWLERKLSKEELENSCEAGLDYIFVKGRLADFLTRVDESLNEVTDRLSSIEMNGLKDQHQALKDRVDKMEIEIKPLAPLPEIVRGLSSDVEKLKKNDREQAIKTATNTAKVVIITAIILAGVTGLISLAHKLLTS